MDRIWIPNYQPGVPADVDTQQYSSIVQMLEESFRHYSKRPAFTNMGQTLSFAEIDARSRRFAAYLQQDLKLNKGDRIALMMPNVLQYPIALFGALRAGLVVVSINPLYTGRELKHQLQDSGAKAIVIFANAAHTLEHVIDQTAVEHVIVTSIGDLLKFPKSLLVNFVLRHVKKMVPRWNLPRARSFRHALKARKKSDFQPVAITQEDTAFLQYTGGTTGVAKGAVLSHGNMIANMIQARAWINPRVNEGRDIIITALPLYHIFSLTANCFVFSSMGALNVLITNPRDIPALVKELGRWRFTAITGVNTLFNALLNNEAFNALDFSSLTLTLGGGMAVQKGVAERWQAVTGHALIEAYGLTETSPAALINPMSLRSYNGYIGLPISSTWVDIRDDKNHSLALGETGEICIKGPQVMQGYWQRPEDTAEVTTEDGYFRTGDLGFMTERGFVKLVDRKKDMILVSGFNVYPNEIEDVVAALPGVLECAVVGVPNAKSGEAPKLFVVRKDPALTSEAIIRHCRENLTSYKIPRQIEFRDDLPKTPVGKVLRRNLQ